MKAGYRNEADNWNSDGEKITSPEKLEAIRTVLETTGAVIVEHWLYYGSSAPRRHIFDDFERCMDYLIHETRAGDAIHVWSFGELCTDSSQLTHGKCPDENGLVPQKGSY